MNIKNPLCWVSVSRHRQGVARGQAVTKCDAEAQPYSLWCWAWAFVCPPVLLLVLGAALPGGQLPSQPTSLQQRRVRIKPPWGKLTQKYTSNAGLYFQKQPVVWGAAASKSFGLRCLEHYFHLNWTFTAPLEISRRGGCSTSLQSTAVLLQGKNVKSETFKIRRSNCYPILGTMQNKQCLGNKKKKRKGKLA